MVNVIPVLSLGAGFFNYMYTKNSHRGIPYLVGSCDKSFLSFRLSTNMQKDAPSYPQFT